MRRRADPARRPPVRPSVFAPRFLRLLRNENIYCRVGVDYKETRARRSDFFPFIL